MNADITLEAEELEESGMTVDQFNEAVKNALSTLHHPITGRPSILTE